MHEIWCFLRSSCWRTQLDVLLEPNEEVGGYWTEWVSLKMLSTFRKKARWKWRRCMPWIAEGMYVHKNKTLRAVDYFVFSQSCWLLPVVSNFINKCGSAYLYFFLLHFMFFFSCCQNKSSKYDRNKLKTLRAKRISYNNAELI